MWPCSLIPGYNESHPQVFGDENDEGEDENDEGEDEDNEGEVENYEGEDENDEGEDEDNEGEDGDDVNDDVRLALSSRKQSFDKCYFLFTILTIFYHFYNLPL